MRIGIFGRGRLGTAIAAQAGEPLVWQLGRDGTPGDEVDVAIDVSAAAGVEGHIDWAVSTGTPLVIGATGWSLPSLTSRVGKKTAILVAPNFSLTVALFRRLATVMGRYAMPLPECDPYIIERHRAGKADAPSGTALMLAQTILAACPRKTSWVMGGGVKPNELSLAVVRAGANCGAHTVGIDSPAEELTIHHQARSIAVFASGALAAARWLVGKSGVHTFDDLAAEILDPLFTHGGCNA